MRQHALVVSLLGCLTTWPAAAQVGHDHRHPAGESLGRVHFPVTCASGTQAAFDKATALLHSFGYEEARQAFGSIAENDPQCGMAHWGVAMTYYHPLWAAPTPEELASGTAAARGAARVKAGSAREQRYIDAIGTFYARTDTLDHGARADAYRAVMTTLAADFPQDDEAQIFHALALLGTAPPHDRAFARQKQAAEILNRLLPDHPDHPGILHYTIHAFDYPELASLALPAARAYAKVAPSSPHALHMPTHIFTRLGLWDESIRSNLDSAATAKRLVAKRHPGKVSFDAVHALDYLEYAYLQQGKDSKAREVLEEVSAASGFDEPNFAAGYALLAVPARYALERRDWKAAAALEVPPVSLPWDRFSYARGLTYFASSVGAARSGDLATARRALTELDRIEAAVAKAPPPGPYDWAGQVASLRLAAAGWVAFGDGNTEQAVRLLTAAAEKEEAVGKHPVTPGALLPAREQLGDLLLEATRPREALEAYEASLADAPKRFNSLVGAAMAAERAGDKTRAAGYYEELVALCGDGCKRPAIEKAQAFLAAR
ncbi:MAG: tetratricopeptide repeat protein [Vicinamibacteraceae bacterium]